MKLGQNMCTLIIMISAQFLGAFLGVLLGYLAIIDKNDQNKFYDYSIPRGWVGVIAPQMPNG